MTTDGSVAASLLRMDGPSGALDVWLGDGTDRATLEAEVRALTASDRCQPSAVAMALGEIALRHKLDVRVISRMSADGPRLLVVFGPRTYKGIRRS